MRPKRRTVAILHRHRSSLSIVHAAVLVLVASGAGGRAEETAAPPEPTDADGSLLTVVAETLVIGPEGTRRAGRDRAVLPVGKTGLLRTETRLPAGPDGTEEEVEVTLKVRPERREDGVHLVVDSTARARPSGQAVLRSGGGLVTETGPLFYEAYAAPATGHRLVFLLSATPWEDRPDLPGGPAEPAPRPVAYRLQIFRLTPDGPELLESPNLGSLVGHAASYGFGFLLSPEGKEPHREQLDLVIRSVDLRDGQLSGVLSLEGVVAGRPVSQARSWLLPSGATAEIDLHLGRAGEEELGFRMVVGVSF